MMELPGWPSTCEGCGRRRHHRRSSPSSVTPRAVQRRALQKTGFEHSTRRGRLPGRPVTSEAGRRGSANGRAGARYRRRVFGSRDGARFRPFATVLTNRPPQGPRLLVKIAAAVDVPPPAEPLPSPPAGGAVQSAQAAVGVVAPRSLAWPCVPPDNLSSWRYL